jgi:hypothetical protein
MLDKMQDKLSSVPYSRLYDSVFHEEERILLDVEPNIKRLLQSRRSE